MITKSFFAKYLRALALIGSVVALLVAMSVHTATAAPTHIGGQVWLDANGDGLKSAPGYIDDIGVTGATVTAFNSDGQNVSTVSQNGTYSIDISTLGAGPFRVELTVPQGYTSAPTGVDTQTTVRQSVQSGNAGVDFAILDPTQYCSANPRLVATCFSNGDGKTAASMNPTSEKASSKTFRFDDEGYRGVAGYNAPRNLTKQSQVGTVYGVAYSRTTGSLYQAAFLRRHAGFGPGSTGAIYVINPTTGAIKSTITIANAGAEPAGRDLPNETVLPSRDIQAFSQVGKVSLGDIDVVGNGNTLFATNLNTRQLVRVDNLSTTPTQSAFSLPDSVTCPGGNADRRPFGLGSRTLNGQIKVYVGVTCSGETNKTISQTQGKVVEFDVTTNAWGSVQVSVPFNTPKGCALRTKLLGQNFNLGCEWSAWNDNPRAVQEYDLGLVGLAAGAGQFHVANPQPVVSDIQFDQTGAMVIGISDRSGWQWGFRNFGPFAKTANDLDRENSIYTGYAAGDQLRACLNGSTFVLENNGTCGGVTTKGAGNAQGPGGGEFYWGDSILVNTGTYTQGHDELSLGALAFVPGRTTMAATATDPFFTTDGIHNDRGNAIGLVKLAHVDDPSINAKAGGWTGAYEIGNAIDGTNDFAKAGGLGDLEVLCESAPLEIGNYVWLDSDKDGIQDPNEIPLEGVSVSLYDNTKGAIVGQAKTDATGHYIFASEGAGNIVALGVDGPNPGDDNINDAYGIVADPNGNLGDSDYGIKKSSNYEVRFDTSTTVITQILANAGIVASDLTLTAVDTDSGPNSDVRDSDGKDVNGTPTISLTTGLAGDNNHTFDVGFSATPVTTTTTQPTTTTTTEPTTTTTEPTTTTTTEPTTTTTAPPTTVTTTTAPEVTVQGTTVTRAKTVVGLPHTGSATFDLAIAALVILLGGLVLATIASVIDTRRI